MRKDTVAPKGMGLNDFVAKEQGFFEAEGLDVSFDWKTFRGTSPKPTASHPGLSSFGRIPISTSRKTSRTCRFRSACA
jgi:hypothetical protein